MKKKIKIMCAIIIALSLITIPCISASAVISPCWKGDVDDKDGVTIDDATLVQKYLAEQVEFSKVMIYAADVNNDDVVTVDDVTDIQKRAAGLIERFDCFWWCFEIENFTASYDSGKAMTDTPIVFDTTAYAYDKLDGKAKFEYEYFIDGKLVQERSENSELSYTFENSGTYEITVNCYNIFDMVKTYSTEYVVIDKYDIDAPIIASAYLDSLYTMEHCSAELTANAAFGTAPYEYSFNFDNGTIVQEFSASNKLHMPGSNLDLGYHKVDITVRDANGNCVTEEFSFVANLMMVG